MGDSPSPPSAAQMQQAQVGANQANIGTELNASNQQTPFGSLTYTPGPGGKWTAQQNYSPAEANLLTQLQGGQGVAAGSIAPMIASGNYGAGAPNLASTSAGPTADLVSGAVGAIKPQAQWMLDQQSTALQNMGLPVGSEAYNRGMEPAFQGLGSAISGFESMFQPTAFGEANTQFKLPLETGSELAQLGAPTPLSGTWAGSPAVQSPFINMASALQQQYQNQAAQYGGELSGIGGLMSGMGSILGAGGSSGIGAGLGALMFA